MKNRRSTPSTSRNSARLASRAPAGEEGSTPADGSPPRTARPTLRSGPGGADAPGPSPRGGFSLLDRLREAGGSRTPSPEVASAASPSMRDTSAAPMAPGTGGRSVTSPRVGVFADLLRAVGDSRTLSPEATATPADSPSLRGAAAARRAPGAGGRPARSPARPSGAPRPARRSPIRAPWATPPTVGGKAADGPRDGSPRVGAGQEESTAEDRAQELARREGAHAYLEQTFGPVSDEDWRGIQAQLLRAQSRNAAGLERARQEAEGMSAADAVLHVGMAAMGLDSASATGRSAEREGDVPRRRRPSPPLYRGAGDGASGRGASSSDEDPARAWDARQAAQEMGEFPRAEFLPAERHPRAERLPAERPADRRREENAEREVGRLQAVLAAQQRSDFVLPAEREVERLSRLVAERQWSAPPARPTRDSRADIASDPFQALFGQAERLLPTRLPPPALGRAARNAYGGAPPPSRGFAASLPAWDVYGGASTRAAAGRDPPRGDGQEVPLTAMERMAAAQEAQLRFVTDESTFGSKADAFTTSDKENKPLLLAFHALQGCGEGTLALGVSAYERSLGARFTAALRSPVATKTDLGVPCVVGKDLVHIILTLQLDKIVLTMFARTNTDQLPAAMPLKTPVAPEATTLAEVRSRSLNLGHVLGLFWSLEVAGAFRTFVERLCATALEFQWSAALTTAYVLRALIATGDAAHELAAVAARWAADAGSPATSYAQALALQNEYAALTGAVNSKIVSPLASKGEGSYLDCYWTERQTRRQYREEVAASRDDAAALGDQRPAGTRARGVDGASAADAPAAPRPRRYTPPMARFVTAAERRAAARALEGCCLHALSNDGCGYTACRYRHERLPNVRRLGPVVVLALVGAGGPAGAEPVPEEARPAEVEALRHLVGLARGYPGAAATAAAARPPGAPRAAAGVPCTWAIPGVGTGATALRPLGRPPAEALRATAAPQPDTPATVRLRSYKAMVVSAHPNLRSESEDVQAFVFNYGVQEALDNRDRDLAAVLAATAAALRRSSLPTSDAAAERLVPGTTRARGEEGAHCLAVSTLTGEPLVTLFPPTHVSTPGGKPVEGTIHALGETGRLLDCGESIGDRQRGHCVLVHLAAAVGVRPSDLLTRLGTEAEAFLQAEDWDAPRLTLSQLTARVLAHDFQRAARPPADGNQDDFSFDIHLVRYLGRPMFITRRFILIVATGQGVEVHEIVGDQFHHGRHSKSASTSYFLLARGHCQLFNPPHQFGGGAPGRAFRRVCSDVGADAWLALVLANGLVPRRFGTYDAATDASGDLPTASLGACACCGLPLCVRLGSAAGRRAEAGPARAPTGEGPNFPQELGCPAALPVPTFAARQGLAGLAKVGGEGLGGGLKVLAGTRNTRTQALAGMSAAKAQSLALPERTLELAADFIDTTPAAEWRVGAAGGRAGASARGFGGGQAAARRRGGIFDGRAVARARGFGGGHEVAKPRPGGEAGTPAAVRRPASESSVTVAKPRPSGESALSAAERRLAPAASEVTKPPPSGETAAPAAERWPAPGASERAKLRPGDEAATPAAVRGLASEPSVAMDEPWPGVETVPSTAERGGAPVVSGVVAVPRPVFGSASPVPAASEVAKLRTSGESASQAAEQRPASAASEVAKPRPSSETASPAAGQRPAIEAAGGLAEPQPGTETVPLMAERGGAPAASGGGGLAAARRRDGVAGGRAEEIKRRGRWQSERWRAYVRADQERGREVAGNMPGSSFALRASLARYERRI